MTTTSGVDVDDDTFDVDDDRYDTLVLPSDAQEVIDQVSVFLVFYDLVLSRNHLRMSIYLIIT